MEANGNQENQDGVKNLHILFYTIQGYCKVLFAMFHKNHH